MQKLGCCLFTRPVGSRPRTAGSQFSLWTVTCPFTLFPGGHINLWSQFQVKTSGSTLLSSFLFFSHALSPGCFRHGAPEDMAVRVYNTEWRLSMVLAGTADLKSPGAKFSRAPPPCTQTPKLSTDLVSRWRILAFFLFRERERWENIRERVGRGNEREVRRVWWRLRRRRRFWKREGLGLGRLVF